MNFVILSEREYFLIASWFSESFLNYQGKLTMPHYLIMYARELEEVLYPKKKNSNRSVDLFYTPVVSACVIADKVEVINTFCMKNGLEIESYQYETSYATSKNVSRASLSIRSIHEESQLWFLNLRQYSWTPHPSEVTLHREAQAMHHFVGQTKIPSSVS